MKKWKGNERRRKGWKKEETKKREGQLETGVRVRGRKDKTVGENGCCMSLRRENRREMKTRKIS